MTPAPPSPPPVAVLNGLKKELPPQHVLLHPAASPRASPKPPTIETVLRPPSTAPPRDESPSALAGLLSASYKEVEELKRELVAARKRADKAERLLSVVSHPGSPRHPSSASKDVDDYAKLPESAIKALTEAETRAERAELARDEFEARLRCVQHLYHQLEQYLSTAEHSMKEARSGFRKVLDEGGGQIVVTPVSLPGEPPEPSKILCAPPSSARAPALPTPPFSAAQPPALSTATRPITALPARRNSNAQMPMSGLQLPPQPYPSLYAAPRASSRRPRTESNDGAYPGAPPHKKARGEERGRERSRRDSFGSHSAHLAAQYPPSAPARAMHYGQVPPAAAAAHQHAYEQQQQQQARYAEDAHRHRHRRRRTRSASRSSSRSTSPSLDEMLLEAADARRSPSPEYRRREAYQGANGHYPPAFHGAHAGPQGVPPGYAPRAPLGAPSQSHGSSRPLATPGQMQTYQTHIFAPPVTGAPVKRAKAGSGGVGANGSVMTLGPNGSVISGPATLGAQGSASFPATNAQGQRICRQCGMPGRYKDGKCVEKWGPGPEGPGTVCDRCRKKMKRVERRGTMEAAQIQGGAPMAQQHAVQRQGTHPGRSPGHHSESGRGHATALGPSGTHLNLLEDGKVTPPYGEGRKAESSLSPLSAESEAGKKDAMEVDEDAEGEEADADGEEASAIMEGEREGVDDELLEAVDAAEAAHAAEEDE